MARYGTTLGQQQTVLIVTKTYPIPSKSYVETTCVAGIDQNNSLVRIFPVPFRLLRDTQQFKRWQWVTANFTSPNDDRRPESRRIDQDSIELGPVVSTDKLWRERVQWVQPHILPSFAALEQRRLQTGQSLGFLRPSELVGLDITPLSETERDWSEAEKAKLTQDMSQPGLFETEIARPRNMLEKLPYRFHYRYTIETPNGTERLKHMITDWEAGALYRNCVNSHGEDWQTPFRQKYEEEFSQKDLIFMMGNMHQYPHQWLIIGIVYPPKPPIADLAQPTLAM